MNKNSLTFKILLIICCNDLLETFAHLCFKKGATLLPGLQVHSATDVLHFVFTMLTSGYVWIGLIAVFIIFVSWSTILSKIDLSLATPATSFSYVMVALVAWLFLHEQISPLRWVGIFFILAGVTVVSKSPHKEPGVAP
jgi:drug/metabolite transporter (DMT)-like permease